VWRPHQYLVPRPLYPHPRGSIEVLPRIVCTQGPIRYGKLNFLDCCKFATIGAFLQRIVVSSLLLAHHYSIRPKVGRPSPSFDTPRYWRARSSRQNRAQLIIGAGPAIISALYEKGLRESLEQMSAKYPKSKPIRYSELGKTQGIEDSHLLFQGGAFAFNNRISGLAAQVRTLPLLQGLILPHGLKT